MAKTKAPEAQVDLTSRSAKRWGVSYADPKKKTEGPFTKGEALRHAAHTGGNACVYSFTETEKAAPVAE